MSVAGGVQPRWRSDGSELFFLTPDDRLMTVAVGNGRAFEAAEPTFAFSGCGGGARENAPFMYRYDVSAEGRRVLWLCPADARSRSARAAVHWAATLDRD